jgi:hypothetical protein
MVLRLTPGTGSNAHGLVAISKQARAGIIEVAGLPATSGRSSVMWWLLARGSATKAAELEPGG